MGRHSSASWRCTTQSAMSGKRVSRSRAGVRDTRLQCLIISVWFTVNSMTTQWQWTLLHWGEDLDQEAKEWKRSKNVPAINASETVNEDERVEGEDWRFHMWQRYALYLKAVLFCIKIMCVTFTLDVGICDPNSNAAKVLVTLVTVTLKYLLAYDVFIILNFISKAEIM